jgi:hypothetical protein
MDLTPLVRSGVNTSVLPSSGSSRSFSVSESLRNNEPRRHRIALRLAMSFRA